MRTKINLERLHGCQRLIFILFLSCPGYALAQHFSPPYTGNTDNNDSPPMSVPEEIAFFVGVSVGTIFMICCLPVCLIFYCSESQDPTTAGPASDGINTNRVVNQKHHGLGQMIIDAFPLIDYAAVKHMTASKSPLECAVCLSEFSENDILRVLPGCQHVFHTNCIDTWLAQHITCPVCRSNLSDPVVVAGKSLLSLNLESDDVGSTSNAPEQVIAQELNVRVHKKLRHVQSAATGGWERFTLNLSEEVMKEFETARRYQKSVSMQDYTYQGKANWRDAKIRAFLNCISWKQRGKERAHVDVAHDVSEASVSTSVSSRKLLGCTTGGEDEIVEIGCKWTDLELTNLPVHERV